jgi:hypothetical protein
MISLRNQETWGDGGSGQVARSEGMCISHAKQGAKAQGSKAEVTPRCDGTYGGNRYVVAFDLQGLYFEQGQESAKVVQIFFVSDTELVVRQVPNDRLDGFQADFPLLLGASFANPNHAAVLGAGRFLIDGKFDHLASPEVETSAQPETFFRGIEDEAGESLRLAVQIDD